MLNTLLKGVEEITALRRSDRAPSSPYHQNNLLAGKVGEHIEAQRRRWKEISAEGEPEWEVMAYLVSRGVRPHYP